MPNDVLRGFSTRMTPQTEPVGNATVKNAAGGYGFQVDLLTQVRRFIILGVAGGTFYVKAPELAAANAKVVQQLAKQDAVLLVDTIVDISTNGRAPKQNPAIFALAMAAAEADQAGKAYALAALPKVCRTLSHLYLFITYVEQFRGWGPALKKAVAKWFTDRPADKLAYQTLKYRQREGQDVRGVLRLSRPVPPTAAHDALFEYFMVRAQGQGSPSARARDKYGDKATSPHAGKLVGQTSKWEDIPSLVPAFTEMQGMASAKRAVELIDSEQGISWEMIPDRLINEPAVWEALLAKGVPMTALLRQLPRLTRLGLTTGQTGDLIVAQLTDPERLLQARVHPLNVLVAQKTYASGQSARGAADRVSATWNPTSQIIDGIHDMFYLSFGTVDPAGVRMLCGTDTSQSMTWNAVAGLPLMALEVAGVMALTMAHVEKDVTQVGFTTSAYPLTITKRQRLDDVMTYLRRQPNGGTDCAAPIAWATRNRTKVDCFALFTDEESWAGRQGHVHQLLRNYRETINPPARLVVASMTPKGYSITDPDDAGSLNVVGFDLSSPQLITQFAAGRV